MAEVHSDLPLHDTQAWALAEVGDTTLGDQCRTRRLVQLVATLAENAALSVPDACGTWADAKAAYRFFSNEAIEPDTILGGHLQATRERLREHAMLLAVQDTTAYSFATHPATKGLGPIGAKAPGHGTYPMGFWVHSCLAVTTEGVPLGLLGYKLWARTDPDGQDKPAERLPYQDRESFRWEQLLKISSQGIPAGTKVLTVADREADIYDFFVAAQELGQDVLVRSKYNRRLPGQVHRLWDVVERTKAIGHLTIEVPRADDKPRRTAHLELHVAPVTLRPPGPAEASRPLSLYAVLVQETQPPEGEEPIQWRLLTTLTVSTAADAGNCVHWYAQRWKIERYHYTLKSGCRIEELQLETLDRLHRALTVYCVVAWRLLYLTYMARMQPDAPCTGFLSDSEWQVLYCMTHRSRKLPPSPPNLQTAVIWIARLGGFLARKGDGFPGVQVLWRGYRRLQDMVATWDLLRTTN